MTRSNLWNYLCFGALILSSLTFALLLLAEQSYWIMRFFFAVAVPVATPLILLAPIFAISTALSFLVKELRWQTIWRIALWISIFTLSSFSFLGAAFTNYELTASANFDHRDYYLVKFLYIDSYKYKLYNCKPLGLLCSRSSGYIGIPYQHDPVYLQYNLKTRKIYIQNDDQIIQIPD